MALGGKMHPDSESFDVQKCEKNILEMDEVLLWVSGSFWLGPSAVLDVFHWGRTHKGADGCTAA